MTASVASGAVGNAQTSSVGADEVTYTSALGGNVRSVASRLDDAVSAATFSSFAAAVAAAAGRRLWVPAGVYPISSSITVNCDLIVDTGVLFNIAAGSAVTFNGHVDAAPRLMFGYVGSDTTQVVFPQNSRTTRAFVEWWGAAQGDGQDAAWINRALRSCRGAQYTKGITVVLSNTAYLDTASAPVDVFPENSIFSEPGSSFNNQGATSGGIGFRINTGNYTGSHVVLPRIASISNAIQLDRCSLVNISVPSIQAVTVGIEMNIAGPPNNGTGYTLLNNKIECQVISQYSQNAVQYSASQPGDTAQGNEIYINFLTGGLRGILWYYVGSGSAVNWDSNKIVCQTIDATNTPGAVGMAVVGGAAVSRLKFHVETWFGGIPPDGAFVTGLFYFSEFKFGLSESINAYSRMAVAGQGNKVETMDRGDDNAFFQMYNTSPSTGSFNGGLPVNTPGFSTYAAPPTTIVANGTYTAYGYSPFVQYHSNRPRVYPIISNGWVVDTVATTAVANEFAITFRNVSGGSNSAGSNWRVETGG